MTSESRSAPDWEGFLRALIETLDEHMSAQERAVLLRAIGQRIAACCPISPEQTLAGLEARMNEHLAGSRWGSVSIALEADGPALVLTHAAPPKLSAGQGGGSDWIAPVLEGLHSGWIGTQPGAAPEIGARLVSADEQCMVIRYGA
ncbi:cellulose biosynthesis protein BcsD [Roseomonas sp. GCM10028921]